jgi:Gpi18-like mannosyltransferase
MHPSPVRPPDERRLAAAPPDSLPGSTARTVATYFASRLLLLSVAGAIAIAHHRPVAQETFLFDGQWYVGLAEHGYPAQALHAQSGLGFFPLYPLVIHVVSWFFNISVAQAALIISIVGGLAATLLVRKLGAAWWGEQAGYRAAVVFCLFPGSIVFSMAYSECLTVPLAVGCLLALRSRHWVTAGLLAGAATAAEPVAIVLIPVCIVASIRHLRMYGYDSRLAQRSIAAPLLAPLGIAAFAVFLWIRTGTPFAAYLAQHYGWHQQNQPLALLNLPPARYLISHPAQLIHEIPAWNITNGVLGGIFLIVSIRALFRIRHELSAGALLLPAGIAAVTLWSLVTPPNARMVLIAFPAVMVWGYRLHGRAFRLFVAAEVVILVFASALTFSGRMLP